MISMNLGKDFFIRYFIILFLFLIYNLSFSQTLEINEQGYYEIPSLNIMVFDDFYPEGHQGGLSIVHFGTRVAANGDVRLEPTPGQWSPVPKVGERKVDRVNNIIETELSYPDPDKNRKGFNPVIYPDLHFSYKVRTESIGQSIKLTVILDEDLPVEWKSKIGFNLEFFPGHYFGDFYSMDGKSGIFPPQPNGPMQTDSEEILQISPMATGKELIISPGNSNKEIKIISNNSDLLLIDGRGLHNNGWFVLRSVFSKDKKGKVIEWIISPVTDTSWRYKPVVQVSQVGYHPRQEKFAVIELDNLTEKFESVSLIKTDSQNKIMKTDISPNYWGEFLRYKYLRFDFSEIKESGIYKIKYGDVESNEFEIKNDIYSRHVWQPVIEYYLPVQMCHMRVKEKYRIWHGLCHMDDAVMAPVNHNHFDGYLQGESTLCHFQPGEHVPGLNIGGWHDAGDYDIRIESQAGTIYRLALAYEIFENKIDETSIDQEKRFVEIHKPDGKPDIIQQIEHGILSIVGGYESLGRLYRGIICSDLDQYVHLGDATTMTDNTIFMPEKNDPVLGLPLPKDDRWVFTENNPHRELSVVQALAAASRVLKNHNPELGKKCLKIAREVFANAEIEDNRKIAAAAELYFTTSDEKYKNIILENESTIIKNVEWYSFVLGRLVEKINNENFSSRISEAVKNNFNKIVEAQKENPYGVPYKPHVWGAGWGIQSFGVGLLMMHIGFPDIIDNNYIFNALNFVLGCHPGENTASFASGVGSNSLTVAYGVNRADWSYIPGGVGSGTALIRPDLPELKIWPYFWQQSEYVMGGGSTNFMLLAMAADYLLNN